MNRREFITLPWPFAVRAHQARRIGVLLTGDAAEPELQNRNKALEAGLREGLDRWPQSQNRLSLDACRRQQPSNSGGRACCDEARI
jgi:hypothetical protein